MSLPLTPYSRWESGTNQNSVPANDNSLRDEIFNTDGIADDVTAQPGTPADGDWYIIPAGATGTQWATFGEDSIAIFYSGTWYEFTPVEGSKVLIAGVLSIYSGSGGWGAITIPAAFTGGALTSALDEAKGANIASATTTDIGAATGNLVHVTGTTTITGLGTVQAGTERVVVFDGALILTHNGTSLILPTGANITTAAGDAAIFRSEGSGNWRCVVYQRKSGAALAGGAGSGDVVGPASAVADRIAVFDLTTGKLIKDGGKTIATVIAEARTPKVVTTVTSNTITPAADTDLLKATGLSAGLTIANYSAAPADGWAIVAMFKDNGTSRSLTWDSKWASAMATLPTATTISKWMVVTAIYDSTSDTYLCMSAQVQP